MAVQDYLVTDAGDSALDAPLFERVVAASGLTSVVAPYTIKRLLLREMIVPPEKVTPAQLERALPGLIDALRVYFDPEDHASATRALWALLD